MLIQETAGRAAAAGAQHAEEVIVGRQLGIGRIRFLPVAQRDAVSIDAAVLPGPKAARYSASSEELKVISLIRFMISRAEVGTSRRSTGLICTISTSSVVVLRNNGKMAGLPM